MAPLPPLALTIDLALPGILQLLASFSKSENQKAYRTPNQAKTLQLIDSVKKGIRSLQKATDPLAQFGPAIGGIGIVLAGLSLANLTIEGTNLFVDFGNSNKPIPVKPGENIIDLFESIDILDRVRSPLKIYATKITSLMMYGNLFKNITFSNVTFNTLQQLLVGNTTIKNIDFSKFRNLVSATIGNYSSSKPLSFTNSPKLKFLTLSNVATPGITVKNKGALMSLILLNSPVPTATVQQFTNVGLLFMIDSVSVLPNLAKFGKLLILAASGIKDTKVVVPRGPIGFVVGGPNLNTLNISNTVQFLSIDTSKLKTLAIPSSVASLSISRTPSLTQLKAPGGWKNVTELTLSQVGLTTLPPVKTMTQLKLLRLENLNKVSGVLELPGSTTENALAVSLYGSNFRGLTIPASCRLSQLNCAYSKINTITVEISEASPVHSLSVLDLYRAPVRTMSPNIVAKLSSSMNVLNLANTQLDYKTLASIIYYATYDTNTDLVLTVDATQYTDAETKAAVDAYSARLSVGGNGSVMIPMRIG